MKRRLFLATITAIPFVPSPASAQWTVICPTCSSLWQQLQDAITTAKAYGTQLLQYKAEFDSYMQLVTAGIQLPISIFQGIQADIATVRGLANAASLLTGNAGSILSRLQSAGGYADQAAMTPSQIGNQFTMWQQTLANVGNSLGRVLGVQQGQLASATATMATAQAHSATAAGQMQAIQAGNEMTAQTVYALQQIQTTLTAAAQEAATRDIVAAERQAAMDANTMAVLQAPQLPLTGYNTYGAANFP
jgi:P-type conjugative transfer protein TrbJ